VTPVNMPIDRLEQVHCRDPREEAPWLLTKRLAMIQKKKISKMKSTC
jgi:hypothetical protein